VVDPVAPCITLPLFLRRTFGLLSRYRIPYDAVVKMRVGEPTYMLTHPDDIRYVLLGNASNYEKTPKLTSADGKLRAGSGVLTASGSEHRRQRRLLQPLFRRKAVTRFSSVILDRLELMYAAWQHRSEVDLAQEMAQLAQSVIIGTLFGIDYRDENGQLADAIHARRLYTQHIYHSRLPFRTRLPLPVVRNYRKAIRLLDETIARETMVRRQNPGPKADWGEDLLALLIGLSYSDGSAINDQLIRDEFLTLTSAGYETVGEALSWTLYLLMTHPDVADELRLAVDTATGGRAIHADDLPRLDFAESVLRESMRLYPPTWVYVRVPTRADRLPSGTNIPAGAKLYLCPWVMHRHPRYFPSAEEFVPARFAAGVESSLRGVYFPFGDGAHSCIGEAFAIQQGVLVLASLAQRFHFDLLPGQTITPRAGITLSPRCGIRASIRAFKSGVNLTHYSNTQQGAL